MVEYDYSPNFKRLFKKIKDEKLKEKITKQILKIIEEPDVGKPMRFSRKGTREVYVKPFRLSYEYRTRENKIIFADLYHKDEQ